MLVASHGRNPSQPSRPNLPTKIEWLRELIRKKWNSTNSRSTNLQQAQVGASWRLKNQRILQSYPPALRCIPHHWTQELSMDSLPWLDRPRRDMHFILPIILLLGVSIFGSPSCKIRSTRMPRHPSHIWNETSFELSHVYDQILIRSLEIWLLTRHQGRTASSLNFSKKIGHSSETTIWSWSNSLATHQLPPSFTCGVLALLHKGGICSHLKNWRPITLLNVAYKIYAKALQLLLQLVLNEIISDDKSTFFPGRFILENIMPTQETIKWAKHSHLPQIFLKLDFSKAYDKVDWVLCLPPWTRWASDKPFLRWFVSSWRKRSTTLMWMAGYFEISRSTRHLAWLPHDAIIISYHLRSLEHSHQETSWVRPHQRYPVANRETECPLTIYWWEVLPF